VLHALQAGDKLEVAVGGHVLGGSVANRNQKDLRHADLLMLEESSLTQTSKVHYIGVDEIERLTIIRHGRSD
jgi:hypothetical protein